MPNDEHLKVLEQGVSVWNRWRADNISLSPDLSKVTLNRLSLNQIDFSGVNLTGASIIETKLSYANFKDADLTESTLIETTLVGADLRGVNFSYAQLAVVTFGNNDLSTTKGLDTVLHRGISTIDVVTIYRSGNNIPVGFLRGCGVPDALINNLTVLIEAEKPKQFHSCFISYSTKDHEFAEMLYSDLLQAGIQCWFAPEDLKIGDKINPSIDESILAYDKLLLVLSKNSVSSSWVEKEVGTALEREARENRKILLPIRLDDAVMDVIGGWPADIRRLRIIGDFQSWRDSATYRKSLQRLLRDLTI
jgi:hypothetical protein